MEQLHALDRSLPRIFKNFALHCTRQHSGIFRASTRSYGMMFALRTISRQLSKRFLSVSSTNSQNTGVSKYATKGICRGQANEMRVLDAMPLRTASPEGRFLLGRKA